MLLSEEQMMDVARAFGDGTPSSVLIDRYEDAIRQSPDVDVSGLSKEELRKTLSVEISRANPRSVRYARTKYGALHKDVEAARIEAFKEAREDTRVRILDTIDKHDGLIEETIGALMETIKGSTDAIEPVATTDDKIKLLESLKEFVILQIQLQVFKDKVTGGPDTNIDMLPLAKK